MSMLKPAEKCPECGGILLTYDHENGEVVCSSCGLVVWEEGAVAPGWMGDHSEPFTGVPRAAKIPRGALLALPTESQRRALREVGRLEDRDKNYIKLAVEVNAIADRINLPSGIRSLACSLANTIKNGLESSSKRMANNEIAAVAVWYTAKKCGFTITHDDFLKACPGLEEKFFKLLHKARGFVEASIAPKGAVEYVPILTAKLSGRQNGEYISALEQYALSIIRAAQPLLKGRNPLATAGTALHIADERMGGRVGRSRLERIGAKFSDRIAKILKSVKAEAPEIAQKKMAEYVIIASRRLASEWFK